MIKSCIAGCLSIALVAMAATASQAQTRTIRTIVPFGPGGAPDIVGRATAEHIDRTRKVSMVVENRPGAGSIIATEAVMRMPADGNAVLITASSFLLNPHLRKVNYNPLADFTPICHLVSAPAVLAVDAKAPHKTVDDLIKAASAAPGKISVGTPGPGTAHHIIFEGFKQRAKADMTYVPYPTTGPAIAAALGGHVSAVLSDYGSLAPQLKSGQLRGLAVSSPSRMTVLPDVPTFSEAGLTGLEWEIWFGVVAPAKVPKSVADELIGWYRDAMADKAATAKLVALELNPKPICGDDFAAFLKKTNEAFGELIRSANIQIKTKK